MGQECGCGDNAATTSEEVGAHSGSVQDRQETPGSNAPPPKLQAASSHKRREDENRQGNTNGKKIELNIEDTAAEFETKLK